MPGPVAAPRTAVSTVERRGIGRVAVTLLALIVPISIVVLGGFAPAASGDPVPVVRTAARPDPRLQGTGQAGPVPRNCVLPGRDSGRAPAAGTRRRRCGGGGHRSAEAGDRDPAGHRVAGTRARPRRRPAVPADNRPHSPRRKGGPSGPRSHRAEPGRHLPTDQARGSPL